METYNFTQFAPSYCTAHIALIRSCNNSAQLLQDLKMKGVEAFPLQLALIDAAYITSPEHILIAIHQALLSNSRSVAAATAAAAAAGSEKGDQVGQIVSVGRGLKTKSIHSEVLWNLSISSNIMDSFRTFGVSEKTKDVLAIHISDQQGPSKEEVLSQIVGIVDGDLEQRGLSTLCVWKVENNKVTTSPVDWKKVVKVYKLDGQTDKRKIESLITSMVAMKNVAS